MLVRLEFYALGARSDRDEYLSQPAIMLRRRSSRPPRRRRACRACRDPGGVRPACGSVPREEVTEQARVVALRAAPGFLFRLGGSTVVVLAWPIPSGKHAN